MMEKLELEIGRKSPQLELTISHKSDSGGTNNYNRLINKPSIQGTTLQGDKSFEELGLHRVTEQDIDRIIYGQEG